MTQQTLLIHTYEFQLYDDLENCWRDRAVFTGTPEEARAAYALFLTEYPYHHLQKDIRAVALVQLEHPEIKPI